MSDKRQEEFEKWAIDNGLNVSWRSGDDYLVVGTMIAWRAWQAARTVPEASSAIFASRCPMCSYRHGHQIGCENNPIDIALRAAAPEGKK